MPKQTDSIAMHPFLNNIRADEVACCFDVSREVHDFLWNTIVPLQTPPTAPLEDRGPEPAEDSEDIATHWHLIPLRFQVAINRAAEVELAFWNNTPASEDHS